MKRVQSMFEFFVQTVGVEVVTENRLLIKLVRVVYSSSTPNSPT